MEGQEAAAIEGGGEDMMRQMMGEFEKMGEKEVSAVGYPEYRRGCVATHGVVHYFFFTFFALALEGLCPLERCASQRGTMCVAPSLSALS